MLDKILELGLKEIFGSSPAEKVTLKDALQGKNRIRLNNGFYHELNLAEVKDFSSKVPLYLWSLVYLPIIILKLPEPGQFSLEGSEWDKKAVSLILNKEEGDKIILNTADVEDLLRRYKTLIFITLSSNILFSANSELDEGI
ncbi:DUF61 family protein [Acidianus ambivalens]|uniref:DUF61 family protein n=1 Tax=Acidianus ambivalens TaxID=2283 RepID=A0A650CT56_ACIAM|nr:DUF61 family protein [Acidianus ambivalens]MQL55376.1 DUF61 family protein [Acidianus ambivalens]QGR20915.1 DUF61 family protein [Acidianus ambivalens]